jgi:hypothetical protein
MFSAFSVRGPRKTSINVGPPAAIVPTCTSALLNQIRLCQRKKKNLKKMRFLKERRAFDASTRPTKSSSLTMLTLCAESITRELYISFGAWFNNGTV